MARRNAAAATDSSRNTSDLEEFLVGRLRRLAKQLRRQKATNDEAEAKLLLHDVIRGHKDVGDVPRELLADFKKVVEERLQEAAANIYLRSL
ncbi:hypothetical protein BDA96_09G038000 [Sorghum bicolor]|jgi:hypothetical protein|uniref:Uncharacterized protein n=2 Tax=Sorghum bicolor TaxID=4558 RepID=A0A921U3H0_SORBI|nr:hypothetical protein BDA96_09G038000 [Sorghum bicolor]OQU77366.1 hypothetical protein SORBI_3009G035601 [Sorghum bicolor]